MKTVYPIWMLIHLSAWVLCCCAGKQMQDVLVSSDVPHTKIYVNGVEQGTTPNYITLDKKKKYNLELKAKGYYPYTKGLSASRGNTFEPISVRMPRNREEFLAMTSPPPVQRQTNDTPSSQAPQSQESQGPNFWGTMAGVVAGAIINTAINEYLGPGAESTFDTTVSTGNTGSRSSISSRREMVCPLCHGTGYSISMKNATNYGTGYTEKYRPLCRKCGGRKKVRL